MSNWSPPSQTPGSGPYSPQQWGQPVVPEKTSDLKRYKWYFIIGGSVLAVGLLCMCGSVAGGLIYMVASAENLSPEQKARSLEYLREVERISRVTPQEGRGQLQAGNAEAAAGFFDDFKADRQRRQEELRALSREGVDARTAALGDQAIELSQTQIDIADQWLKVVARIEPMGEGGNRDDPKAAILGASAFVTQLIAMTDDLDRLDAQYETLTKAIEKRKAVLSP